MDPFVLAGPAVPEVPLVASVPHSGTEVPEEILDRLRPEARPLPDTDWHVDRLFDFLPKLGVPVLVATQSRYVVDLNRDPSARRFGPMAESLVAAESFDGRPVYDEAPSESEIKERVERFYLPYHRKLRALVDACVDRFGRAYVVDLHSFDGPPDADVVLGDDEGRLNADTLMGTLRDELGSRFRLVENEVWTGGHIALTCGALPGVEAVQIETDHAAYLDPGEVSRATSTELGTLSPPQWDGDRFWTARRRYEDAFGAIVERLVPS